MTDVKIKVNSCKQEIKQGTYLLIDDTLMQVVQTNHSEHLLINVLTGNRQLDDPVPVPCTFDTFFSWYRNCTGGAGDTMWTIDKVNIEVVL